MLRAPTATDTGWCFGSDPSVGKASPKEASPSTSPQKEESDHLTRTIQSGASQYLSQVSDAQSVRRKKIAYWKLNIVTHCQLQRQLELGADTRFSCIEPQTPGFLSPRSTQIDSWRNLVVGPHGHRTREIRRMRSDSLPFD